MGDLFEVTLKGPGGGVETTRATPSEVIALEKNGYTITARRRHDGVTLFAEATQALARLQRHAELTGNAELLGKAEDAVTALLRGNPLLGGGSQPARERTKIGVGGRR